MPNRNSLVIQEAKKGMEKFKTEVANELGLQQYDNLDKGELTSRQNGYVGGNMTKKMVFFAESVINEQGPEVVSQAPTLELPERIRKQNELASQGLSPGQLIQNQFDDQNQKQFH